MLRLAVATCLLAFCLAAPASAGTYLPPSGKVWHGVASGDDVRDFTARTGRAPAVWQHWIQWGGGFSHAFARSAESNTRLMLHLSTAPGQNMAGRISPGAIARGDGDGYLLRLNRALAEHGAPAYLRLMGEMNNCDLAYSSHGCDGRARGSDHSAQRFRKAWRRSVLILRGGPLARIDTRLRAQGLPPVRGARGDELPQPQLAVLWSPMTGGSPMIAALRPERFWPGRAYVDWVSTSFYSRFPNFHFLEPFYQRFAVGQRKPFAFGEYAMWGGDDAGFARRLVGWVRSHPHVRMLIYNQGDKSFGPFRLRRYPQAARVLRGALSSPRYAGVPDAPTS